MKRGIVLKPLISIVIPVYNVENYLVQCLDSIINQDVENIEIILIDDGSTDNSSEICDSYAMTHKNIKVFHSQNKGQSIARNRGISEASGEYIFFVDSDDYLIDGSLRKIVKTLSEDLDLDLLLVKIKIFFEGTDKVFPKAKYHNFKKVIGKTGEEAFQFLVKTRQFLVSPYSYIVKRSILVTNNILYDTELRSGEDILFTPLVYFNSKKVSCVDDFVLMYRKNRVGQLTKNINIDKEKNLFLALNGKFNDSRRWDISNETRRTYRKYISNIYAYSLSKNSTGNNGKDWIKMLKEYEHFILSAGGSRFILPKLVYLFFGYNACVATLIFMKKFYDLLRLHNRK